MKDIIRDSTVGQLINHLSGGRYLPYADQRPDYVIPAHFLLPSASKDELASIDEKPEKATRVATPIVTPEERFSSNDKNQDAVSVESVTFASTSPPVGGGSMTRINTPVPMGSNHDHEKGSIKEEVLAFDPYLVGWNGDDDPDNPQFVNIFSLPQFRTEYISRYIATGRLENVPSRHFPSAF
jgi:DHA1 family multidrug resistance protein-like MFS transporter